MINISIDNELYKKLIDILQEKFNTTIDLNELSVLNQLLLALKYESDSWVSDRVMKKLKTTI